jgi:hypothetical protein
MGDAMLKVIAPATVVFFALSMAPTTAAAEKKPTCDAYCAAKVCATANSKNFCMQKCVQGCNQTRAK